MAMTTHATSAPAPLRRRQLSQRFEKTGSNSKVWIAIAAATVLFAGILVFAVL